MVTRKVTDHYRELEKVSRGLGDQNQCGVIAVSVVAGIPYDQALELLTKWGRVKGKGTPNWIIHKVLEELGFKVEDYPASEIVKLYPGRHSEKRWVTTHHPSRFHSVWPKGVFLLYPRAHVLAVVDGVVHDWSSQNSLQVKSIFKVTRNA